MLHCAVKTATCARTVVASRTSIPTTVASFTVGPLPYTPTIENISVSWRSMPKQYKPPSYSYQTFFLKISLVPQDLWPNPLSPIQLDVSVRVVRGLVERL